MSCILQHSFLNIIRISNFKICIDGDDIAIKEYNKRAKASKLFIPFFITRINKDVLSMNDNIREVVFQEGSMLKRIPNESFQSCKHLTSINIPSGVSYIGESAFCFCSMLHSVEIPENSALERISDAAFRDCKALKSIKVPDSVTDIGEGAFTGCESLESARIPKGVTKLSSSVFGCCRNLASVRIPEGVTSIGNGVFEHCSALEQLELPNSLKRIGSWTFKNTALKDIKLPEGLEEIGANVRAILAAKASDAIADTSALETRIDLLVYHLYGLTYDEVLIVDPETPITREEYEHNKTI